MGRPCTGALSSFDASIRARLTILRGNHEGWGPTTLRCELEKHPTNSYPCRSSIGRYLQEQQLSQRYERHQALPVEAVKKAKRSHSLWQVDGQGNSDVHGVGAIAMLNIMDVHSKIYVSCFPAMMKNMQGHPNTLDYQTAMRLGFVNHGRPRRLQSDHASVFYDNKSKSPFPTLFCLWLIALDIEPCFSRVHRPTDQGQVERAHQTLFNQVLKGRGDYKNWNHLFEWCEQRRIALNQTIPSTACKNQPPLVRHPKAKHSGRFYHPQTEAQLLDMNKVFNFLTKGKWFRKVAANQTVCLGGHTYYISGATPKEQLQISFCKKDQHLSFQNAKELVLASLPLKGIDKQALMGDLGVLTNFATIQLEIPFSWEAIKVNTTLSDS
jgi:transposase InsO family protein